MDISWKKLIKRYAGDRQICNCGCAYYTNCGEGIDRNGIQRNDLPACQYGCSANIFITAEHIAQCMLKELGETE